MFAPTNRLVVISGCSGGGKSTLLNELHNRGFDVVEEPGRRIIAEERQANGSALPWIDMEALAQRAFEMSLSDIDRFPNPSRWVFIDRGLIDAACGLSRIRGEPIAGYLSSHLTYCRKVFLTPPWPEIYVTDTERQHLLSQAVQEYEALLRVYPSIGYEVVILLKVGVEARADLLLHHLRQ